MLERELNPQKAAAAPSEAAAQRPRPAEPASLACVVAADIHATCMPPTAALSLQSQLQQINRAEDKASVERTSREPLDLHDKPVHASGAPQTLPSSATRADASGAAGQESQTLAVQRCFRAEPAIQWRQVDRQAASEKGCLDMAVDALPLEAAPPGTLKSVAFGVPVHAEPDGQAQLNQASICQPQLEAGKLRLQVEPAAGGMQTVATPRQPDPWPARLPESVAAHALSQQAPGSEELLLPHPAAGSKEAAQLDMQPGPWRSKRKAISQTPCRSEEPPATAQRDGLAQDGTVDNVLIREPGASDTPEPSAKRSQLHFRQRDSNELCEGSKSTLETPAWLQDQVT